VKAGRSVGVVALLAALLAALSGCTVSSEGGYGGVGVSYVGGYYEPFGYDYGGWGPGYVVGPARAGRGRAGTGPGRAGGGYRHAAPGRAMPSIPQRSRR